MKEILGNNLKKFFDVIDSKCEEADITYAGNEYEIWQVSDVLFVNMCEMSEEEFVKLAGEDAWWRSSEGSNLGGVSGTIEINGVTLFGWVREEDIHIPSYHKLTDYLCNYIGASQPRNVVACAVDLAKYNNMTMSELFNKCEN